MGKKDDMAFEVLFRGASELFSHNAIMEGLTLGLKLFDLSNYDRLHQNIKELVTTGPFDTKKL